MTEKITIAEINQLDRRGVFLSRAFFVLMGENRPLFDSILANNANPETNVIEFDLKINGVEVKFSKILDWLDNAFDHCVKKEAQKMVSEKVKDLNDFTEELHRKLKDKAREFFPDFDDDY